MTSRSRRKQLWEPGLIPAPGALAETWIAANPVEARLGRFASDLQPKSRQHDDDHA
ncbi:hypothetical protein [Streptomyces eurythermus]|uniref:hypothetical protein n=1 Tax=Streptomyces eurythermus TaxID=42237 RepID=UPI0036FB3108